eukprot:TRINITY_DN21174_c0_g5_i1.p1 TRINITY_DN21174_c0_g5~~TRINITY_DN21174_c0_g5_i1.p1  ORF type:complete len:866 (-),score=193.71 TRINITY_DN21174_c0_g5_i1:389-2866(-)
MIRARAAPLLALVLARLACRSALAEALNVSGRIKEMPDCIDLTLSKEALKLSNSEKAIQLSLATNGFQLLALLLVFGCLNRSRHAAAILAPKRVGDARSQRLLLGWLTEACFMDLQELSLDAQVFVRFLQLGLKFSIVGLIVGGSLLPLFASGEAKASGFLRYSISNLTPGNSQVFWYVVLAAYLKTAAFLALMRSEWNHFVAMRRGYFAKRARGQLGASAAQAQHSVLVERVPAQARSAEALQALFAELFGEKRVRSCVACCSTVELYRLRDLKWTIKLASARTACCRRTRSGLQKSLRAVVELERGVTQWLYTAMDGLLLDQPIRAAHHAPSDGASSTAFVTLTSASARLIAERLVLFDRGSESETDHLNWVVQPAPEARDIVWPNVSYPLTQVRARSRLGSLACFVGVLFWSIPVTGIQLYVGSQNHWDPRLIRYLERAGVKSLVLDYVPVLALMALLLLLPYGLTWLSLRFEMLKTKSQIQRKVLARNLRFQLATLYVNVFTGVIVDTFRDVLRHPVCASFILGKSVPRLAVYFTIFVNARIGVTLPLMLLQPWNYMTFDVYAVLRRRKTCGPFYCQFGSEASTVAIVLVLALMYCLIAPLIMPLCVVFFALATAVYRWLFLNVYSEEFDCSGDFWYDLFDGAMIGLILAQLSLSGIAALYTSTSSYEVGALLVLLLLTVWSWRRLTNDFVGLSQTMSYQEAVKSSQASAEVCKGFRDDYYMDPLLLRIHERLRRAKADRDAECDLSHDRLQDGRHYYQSLVLAVLDEDLAGDAEGSDDNGESCSSDAEAGNSSQEELGLLRSVRQRSVESCEADLSEDSS